MSVKNVNRFFSVAAFAALLAVTLFSACTFGLLSSGESKNGTTISVSMASSSAAVGSRAVASGTGCLYIQTGIKSGESTLYGPYSESDSEFTITDIPAGTYGPFILVYAQKAPAAGLGVLTPETSTAAGYLAALQSYWSGDSASIEGSSFAYIDSQTIKAFSKNTISAALIPTTDLTATGSGSLTLDGSEGAATRRFIKVTGVSSAFTGITKSLCSLDCAATNPTSSSLTVSAVGLYESAGTKVLYDGTAETVAAGEQKTYSANWTGNDSYYLYVDFTGSKVQLDLSGVIAPAVYVAGYVKNSSNVNVAGYWMNGTWTELGNPYDASKSSVAVSVLVSGSDIYVSGEAIGTSGVFVAGYWKNGSWSEASNPYGSSYGAASASIILSGSDVYLLGYVFTAASVRTAGYWKNGTWVELDNPEGSAYWGSATKLVVSGSDVYASGMIGNSSYENIPGYWLNGEWVALANPAGSLYAAAVESFDVSIGNVYAAGYATSSSCVKIAGYWLNGVWVALANPAGSYDAQVCSSCISGSDVYDAGYCLNSSSYDVAGYWKNGTWTSLPNPAGAYTAVAYSVIVSGSDVYAAGSSINASSVSVAGYWKNGTWVGFDNPYGSSRNAYVCGAFVVSP